jgi:hypothetical protein
MEAEGHAKEPSLALVKLFFGAALVNKPIKRLKMDPVQIISTALALGAPVALKVAAETAVKDAYAALKSLVLSRFGSKGETARAVSAIEAKPESDARKTVLAEELESVGAGSDQEIVDSATALLSILESQSPGVTGGLVGQINAAGGKVVVVGSNYGPIQM